MYTVFTKNSATVRCIIISKAIRSDESGINKQYLYMVFNPSDFYLDFPDAIHEYLNPVQFIPR